MPQEPLHRIAFEKASIAKPGSPLVTLNYPVSVVRQIIDMAKMIGAQPAVRGVHWRALGGECIDYGDAWGELMLPLPMLRGAHQADNAALAVAMLRHQGQVTVSPGAMATGIRNARWPARLQLLGTGPLTALVPGRPDVRNVWLDGGHNPDAGAAIARFFGASQSLHLIIGMLASKDPAALLAPLAGLLASVTIVPAPGHDAHAPEHFAPHTTLPVRAFATVEEALRALPPEGDVLIAGSLYLAGEVLRLNRELPD